LIRTEIHVNIFTLTEILSKVMLHVKMQQSYH